MNAVINWNLKISINIRYNYYKSIFEIFVIVFVVEKAPVACYSLILFHKIVPLTKA